MPRKQRKNPDWTLSQWPDDLSNTNMLSTPYECCACKKPCKSITTLRTHKCEIKRKAA